MGIAFFDLDYTLLATNSGKVWLKRELALGRISRWQAVQATFWFLRYNLGMTSVDHAVGKVMAALAGTQEDQLRTRTSDFYRDYIRQHFRPGARAALEAHRKAGDKRVLLTAASPYLSELVGEELELDEIICTRLEVDAEGCYTGKLMGTVCFGLGKLEHAQRFAETNGVSLADCHFYTDSYSDLPVLLAVGNPRPVHPDYRLRREATRRRWPILDWGVPTG